MALVLLSSVGLNFRVSSSQICMGSDRNDLVKIPNSAIGKFISAIRLKIWSTSYGSLCAVNYGFLVYACLFVEGCLSHYLFCPVLWCYPFFFFSERGSPVLEHLGSPPLLQVCIQLSGAWMARFYCSPKYSVTNAFLCLPDTPLLIHFQIVCLWHVYIMLAGHSQSVINKYCQQDILPPRTFLVDK